MQSGVCVDVLKQRIIGDIVKSQSRAILSDEAMFDYYLHQERVSRKEGEFKFR
jgi:hypothetical protein